MRILVFCIILCCSVVLKAQTFEWAMQSGNSASDFGTNITTDHMGNVVTAGIFQGNILLGGNLLNGGGSSNYFITKADSSGNVVWARCIQGGFGSGCYLSTDNLNNIFVTGTCGNSTFAGGSNTITVNPPKLSAFIAKYDSNGNLNWVKVFGDSAFNLSGTAIKTDSNGNSYITGHGSKPYHYMYFVAKYDSNGNLLWKESHSHLSYVFPVSVDIDGTGNCYVTGNFSDTVIFSSTTVLSNNQGKIFIAKIAPNGNLLWLKKEGSNNDEVRCIKVEKNGIFLLTGSYITPSVFGNTILNANNNSKPSMFLGKYDNSGNNIWVKTAYAGITEGQGVCSNENGDCLVICSMNTVAILGVGSNSVQINPAKKYGELFVAKYDINGNFIWAIAPGGSNNDVNYAAGICAYKNDSYITGGFSETTIFGNQTLLAPYSSSGYSDIFIAKIKDNTIATNLDPYKALSIQNSIYPNPTNGLIIVKSQDTKAQTEINIMNVTGQLLYSRTIHSFTHSLIEYFDLTGLPKGIYFVEINTGDERTVKKVVLQ